MYSGEGWEYQVRWWAGENWDCEMVKCWAGSTRWDGEMPLSVLRNWWWTKLKYNYKSHWYIYVKMILHILSNFIISWCQWVGFGKIGLDEQCFKVSGSEHNILCTLEDIHLTSSESHVSSLTSRVRICLTMFWEVLISIEAHSILFVHVIYVIGRVGAFVWDRHQFNLKTYHKIDFWNIFVIS